MAGALLVADLAWVRGEGLVVVTAGPDAQGRFRARWVYQGRPQDYDPTVNTVVITQADVVAVWHADQT